MSEKEPKNKETADQPHANPSQGAGAQPAASTTTAPKGTGTAVVLLPLVLIIAGTFAWYALNQKNSPPVASAAHGVESTHEVEDGPVDGSLAEEAHAGDAAPEPEAETAPAPDALTAGMLEVRSDVAGADVFLDGKRVGTTPYKAVDLAPGKHSVRVEKAGFKPFEKGVDLGSKQQVVRAKLLPPPATLRVEANVPGARVLLDGEEKGTTPLELSNVSPGRHEVGVSAEGYESHTETVEVESGGKRDIKVDLVSPLAALNEAVAVKHKHRIGSCDGVLRAGGDRLVYDSSHKDAFSIALSEVERFALEKESLTVKVRDGRNYNFDERNDNPPALASFHERVAAALEKGK
jgi:hypothetical protein